MWGKKENKLDPIKEENNLIKKCEFCEINEADPDSYDDCLFCEECYYKNWEVAIEEWEKSGKWYWLAPSYVDGLDPSDQSKYATLEEIKEYFKKRRNKMADFKCTKCGCKPVVWNYKTKLCVSCDLKQDKEKQNGK